MDAVVKEKWVAALRSGEYQQGRGKLRSIDNEFCCLGVLCDVVDPEGWESNPDSAFNHMHHRGRAYTPSLRVFEWNGPAGVQSLGQKNDVLGWTFPEIADWIEANL